MEKIVESIELEEYIAILRCCVEEYHHLDEKVIETVHHICDVSWNFSNNELEEQIHAHQEVTEKMLRIMEEYVNDLQRKMELNSELPCPFLDFVSNINIESWWNEAYPIIEKIATVTGAITGVATIAATPVAFRKWIYNKLQEKHKKDEYDWIRLILNENEWSISTLAQKLELPEDETKGLLKAFGYKWDAKKMLYTATENTHKLRNIKLNSETL